MGVEGGEMNGEFGGLADLKKVAKGKKRSSRKQGRKDLLRAIDLPPGDAFGIDDLENLLDSLDQPMVEVEATAVEDYAAALAESAAPEAEPLGVGERFQYDIAAPVTIKRGQSAMVPLLTGELEAVKELIYNKGSTGPHPLLCMRLMNKLGVVLERGPIVVFEDSAYGGEGILPRMAEGDEIRLAYAVATGVTITEKWEAERDFRSLELDGLDVVWKDNQDRACTYTCANESDSEWDLVIEHPHTKEKGPEGKLVTPEGGDDWKLHKMADPFEVGEHHYRYRFGLSPRKQIRFEVKERLISEDRFPITSRGRNTYRDWLKEEKLDQKQLDRVILIQDADHDLHQLQDRLRRLEDQSRQASEAMNELRVFISQREQVKGGSQNERSRAVELLKRVEFRYAELRRTIIRVKEVERDLQRWLKWVAGGEKGKVAAPMAAQESRKEAFKIVRHLLDEAPIENWLGNRSTAVLKSDP
jgi:hypothetical protein